MAINMDSLVAPGLLSVEEYLESEHHREYRQEYAGGMIFRMPDASDNHQFITGSFYMRFRKELAETPWCAFMTQLKARLATPRGEFIYYPDVMVASDEREDSPYYRRFPKAVIEVLAESTNRTDRVEKLLTYQQCASIEEYAIASQDRMEVLLYRRAENWRREILTLPDQEAHFFSINVSISLREIYDGVQFRHPASI